MRNSVKDTWILTKAGLLNTYSIRKFSNKKSGGSIFRPILYALLFAMLLPVSFLYYEGIAMALEESAGGEGIILLVFIVILVVTAATFFTCLFKASSFLFSFKDFDMLGSFPVKMGSILASKMIMLYVSNLVLVLFFGFPGLIIYGIHAGQGIIYYLYAVVIFFLLPVPPILAGSVLSFILTKAMSGFKRTNLLMITGSFALVFVTFFLSQYFQRLLSSDMAADITGISEMIRYYFPGEMFYKALINLDALWFLLAVIFNIGLTLIFILIFSKSFKRVNSMLSETSSRSDYRMEALSVSSTIVALYKKELRSYFSSYIYVLNTSVGMILMTFYIVAMVFFDFEEITAVMDMPMASTSVLPFTIVVAIFCIAISCTTAVSFSMEGKCITLLKSLPVKFSEIGKSKILVNLTVTLPLVLVDSIILLILFKFSFYNYMLFLLPCVVYAVLSALVGIVINLYLPKMEWKSQVQVVKQSASTMAALLVNAILAALPILLYLFLTSNGYGPALNIYIIAVICILSAVCIYLWAFIKKRGEILFQKL